jgi:hypothetical protein
MFPRTMVIGALFEARLRTSCDQQPWRRSACRAVAGIASESWWSQTGSNRRPHACKARALPAELWPRNQKTNAFDALAFAGGTARRPSFKEACRAEAAEQRRLVGLGRLELPTSRLSSARSNQLSYKPLTHIPLRTPDPASCRPSACSSAKKEKRRRRNPANGAQRSGDLLAPDVSKTIR